MHLRIVSRMWYFSNVPNGAERRKFCKSLIFFWFLYSNQGCRATPILVCSGVRVYPPPGVEDAALLRYSWRSPLTKP